MKTFLIIISLSVLVACKKDTTKADVEKWTLEIMEVEKAFNDMAQNEGVVKAFEYYAAKDGVIKRGKRIIKGKKAIEDWYSNDIKPGETLTWTPTFVDVSKFGDLAYTYGDFVFTYKDSLGNEKQNKGIFHTVWKRQENGSWRFVYD